MKSCAIITEYNPFHNGHKYQLQKARELTGCDCLIVLMSGNFVQRGESALISKDLRTKIALDCGADLVIELPFFASLQSADNFGGIAVSLLGSMNVDTLCFGTDYDEDFDYQAFIQQEQAKKSELDQALQEIAIKHPNYGYPKRMDLAYQEVFGHNLALDKPNHILGISYARANHQLVSPMDLLPIKRIGATHYDDVKDQFASGTAIRKLAYDKDFTTIAKVVPKETVKVLKQAFLHDLEKYYPLLKMQILSKDVASLSQIYQMTEGLEHRIKKVTTNSRSFAEWLENLQTKRYTIARLQRLAMYILLNLTKQDVSYLLEQRYLKVLGFNKAGRSYLKHCQSDIPIITALRQQDKDILAFEQRVDEIYHLVESSNFNFAKMYQPIIIE